ncbi:DedA family protein [Deinococcus sp. Marseille-Q6407]|uniref:DedA family protein n=1 Tax=Deinococcus sp. Marseille-Q6407 TaxID=2969223 RepID=UPI0021BE3228|nr:DedA family protein [Deinococcus sp. Marseille-Q6407]
MIDWLLNVMNSLGYVGVFLLMVLENLFPPIPSEVIMPAAGFAASPEQGQLNIFGVIAAGALGSVIGTLPLYYVGKVFGLERSKRWADRYGRWLTVSGDDLQKASDWFDRHGAGAVLFGRMVPGVRSLLSLPAGINAMNMPQFLLYSLIGSGLWAALLAGAGYLLGEHYDRVAQYVDPASKIILGLLVLGFIWWVLSRRRAGKGGSAGDGAAS